MISRDSLFKILGITDVMNLPAAVMSLLNGDTSIRDDKPASDYLCWSRFGEVMSSRGVATMIKDYGAKAGIRKEVLHPHAFRHFFAKQYLKNSKDIAQLSMLLGHARLDTTSIYLQKSYEEQKRDFDRHVTW